MYDVTGDRDAVLKIMKQTIRQLGQDDAAPLAKSALRGLKAPKQMTAAARARQKAKWSAARDEYIGHLKRAFDREQDKAQTEARSAPAAKSVRGKTSGLKAKHLAPAAAPSESARKEHYMPRDRTVAVFQAAMDEYIDLKLAATEAAKGKKSGGKAKALLQVTDAAQSKREKDAAQQEQQSSVDINIFFETQTKKPAAVARKAGTHLVPKGFAPLKSPFEEFGNLDPGWGEVIIAKLRAMFQRKVEFILHKSLADFRFALPAQTTIAVVSDWGGGNEAARLVAEQIKRRRPEMVIHLGDIYYAGTEHEAHKRFLDLWNFTDAADAKPSRTFALNGNHEMYSGGHAYFETVLKALKQPASYFCLANEHWQLIGLDTAFVDHDLNPEQLQWLAHQINNAPASVKNAKNVLLSHHQPYSAFEKSDKGAFLRKSVRPLTDAGRIHGWLWGHEHLCAVYENHLGIKGRCVGHGCIPYELPRDPSASADVKVRWWHKRRQTDGGGMQGFALLTIDGARMQIEYIDRDGKVAKTEADFQNSETRLN